MSTAPRIELLNAWTDFEDEIRRLYANKKFRPTAKTHARAAARLEEACKPVAAALGLTVSQLRDQLAAHRRAGLDRPAALKAVEEAPMT